MIDKIRTLLPGNFDLARQTLQNLEDNGPMAACMNLQAAHNIIIMNYDEHEKLSNTLSRDIKAEVIPLLKSSVGLTEEQEKGIEQEVFDKYKEGLNTPTLASGIIDPMILQEAPAGEKTMLEHELGHALNILGKATTELTEVYAQQQALNEKAPDKPSYTNFEKLRKLDGQAKDCQMQIRSTVYTIEKLSAVIKSKNPKGGELTETLQKFASGGAELEEASEDPEKANDLETMLANTVGLGKRPD